MRRPERTADSGTGGSDRSARTWDSLGVGSEPEARERRERAVARLRGRNGRGFCGGDRLPVGSGLLDLAQLLEGPGIAGGELERMSPVVGCTGQLARLPSRVATPAQ